MLRLIFRHFTPVTKCVQVFERLWTYPIQLPWDTNEKLVTEKIEGKDDMTRTSLLHDTGSGVV